MQSKTFEIRDRGTFIPALAIKVRSDGNEKDRYLLRRAGLDHGAYDNAVFINVYLINLQTGEGHLDRYKWRGAPTVRTMPVAHRYIEKNFDQLETGSVIDVEFILGETKDMKKSESLYL